MLSENDLATLYNNDVRGFIHTRPWPSGLIIDIEEYDGYLQFILYRDNFNRFDGEDRDQIANQVRVVMEAIRGTGIPIYMEVRRGNGQRELL